MVRRLVAAFAAAALVVPGALAQETARYRIDIDVTWSPATHPVEFFPGAHLTTLIGARHHDRYVLFGDGRTASSGLQSVAERGKNLILKAELEDQRDRGERGRVGEIFEGSGLDRPPGKMTASFTATAAHNLVSFVTMIAPSPDWFTGAASLALQKDGKWVDRVEVTLWPWDAGTDSGATWTAENAETQPKESVRLLVAPYFFDAGGLKPLGKATVMRLE